MTFYFFEDFLEVAAEIQEADHGHFQRP